MKSATRSLARAVVVMVGTGGLLLGASGMAAADPAPGCTAGDVTAVMTGVSAGMTTYLFTHPDVNDFFTSLQGLSKSVAKQKTKDYLAANPQIHDEIEAIREPGKELRDRCGIPLKAEIAGVL